MTQVVKRLLRLSLLNRLERPQGQSPVYDLYPLMREFALELLLREVETVPGRKERIDALLESLRQTEQRQGLLELLQDRGQLGQVMDAAEYCDRVLDFARVRALAGLVNGPLDALGHWDEKLRLNRLAVRAAVALQARQAFAEALAITREVKDTNGILFTSYSLAQIDYRLHLWGAAVSNNLRGIREACRYGDLYWLGGFAKTIGWTYRRFVDDAASSMPWSTCARPEGTRAPTACATWSGRFTS
jgi:hypothetical protein